MTPLRSSAESASGSEPGAPAAPARCTVLTLDAHRHWLAAERRDAAVNAAWDGLLVLAREAWVWRDPECLAMLEIQLAALKSAALGDWQA
jgi:hypothetical protein